MIARVIVDISSAQVDRIFDYLIPSDLTISKGDRVQVPFGPRKIEGFCIDIVEKSDVDNLKPIITKLDSFTCIKPEMLELMKYMNENLFIRYADSLRLFIPPKLRGGRIKELTKLYVELAIPYEEAIKKVSERARVQRSVIDYLKDGGEFLKKLNEKFGAGAVTALAKAGIVNKQDMEVERTPFMQIQGEKKDYTLTSQQQAALDKIFSTDKSTILLHGVTGSGKTVVYMNAIQKALAMGKTCMMLVPEISLTPQMLKNFRAFFGDTVAMLHSGLSDGERYDEWRRLHSGQAKIVVGARSAIFAPIENIGLIIIDEEHDSSYASDSNPRFKTVDIAEFRAKYNKGKVILGSATPSLETYQNAVEGKYELIKMPDRIGSHGMPPITIVDMGREVLYGNTGIFSVELRDALIETVKKGEQAMIFLNRRGHSSFVMCKKCGYVAKCTDCDITLTYHRTDNTLKCHYCGNRYHMLDKCPNCGSDSIRFGKTGTEKVVEEIEKLIPGVKVLRMDNDTTTTKTAYLDILSAFGRGEAQVLVGTQMIAKGHDFPNVTLVGIQDADISLYNNDYRASERTFQLVTQIAGRAGRADKAGRVFLQTYSPRHYVYQYAKENNFVGFIEKENNIRKTTQFPPYATIVRILMSSPNEEKVIEVAKRLYNDMRKLREKRPNDFIYLQAMKSPIAKVESKYRYQIIARINRENEIDVLSQIHQIVDKNRANNVFNFIEVDPKNLS